ncbi:hypothetical protein [Cryobacterium sp. Y82]|uniref:hypothetical protein n=1 Tax=Cryobacterium sp. Y82 TaxID=2045017 RepID=UPI000CE389EB|nr:hypothetical protein [Cryobacterium sp. Y82]
MSTFQDPITDADEACEALRTLAHATRRFNDPAQTYDVIGNLLAAVRSLQQVLDQVASAHLEHQDRAFTDSGDSVAGSAHADRAANAIHDAAQHLGYVENSLDLASQHSGRIAWHAAPTQQQPSVREAQCTTTAIYSKNRC